MRFLHGIGGFVAGLFGATACVYAAMYVSWFFPEGAWVVPPAVGIGVAAYAVHLRRLNPGQPFVTGLVAGAAVQAAAVCLAFGTLAGYGNS